MPELAPTRRPEAPCARATPPPPHDPESIRRAHRLVSPITRRWFRSEVRGLMRLPATQTLVVAHHDGGMLPVNGVCFAIAWHELHSFARPLYVLTHDVFHDLSPRVARALAGVGLVRADSASADQVLASGASVLVFPGAARETFRTYRRRCDIDLGGRAGLVKKALRFRVPITPVVSAGSHETLFVLSTGRTLAHKLGIPRLVRSADVFPISAGLPWGIWALPCLPQLPLPAKITTEVLEPIWLPDVLGRALGPADADDPDVVDAGFRIVLDRMRAALRRLYAERRFPVLG